VSVLRNVLCWVLIAIIPASLFASDTGVAMLYSKGATSLNGNLAPDSTAIFPGDVVQTQPGSVANINAAGSSVMVAPESMVKFQSNSVCVEHGMATIATSTQMAALAGGLRVTPSSTTWTQFDVRDVDGTVQVIARKSDLNIQDGSKTTQLAQGQQAALEGRDTNDGCTRKKAAAAPAAGSGGLLSSTPAIWTAAGVGAGILIWVLIQGDDPLSPDQRTCLKTNC
jgi:hypothetical protein